MTDKEKMRSILDTAGMSAGSIESIFHTFLCLYGSSLSIETVNDLYEQISRLRDDKINELVTLKYVAKERAGCLKRYLEGKTWPTEELARQYLQPQINNAQAILDACGGKYHV